ncbi:MAG: B12-binding domain-containing protein [Phycisphaerae bacterium]
MQAAFGFVRAAQMPIANPEILGILTENGHAVGNLAAASVKLEEALISGQRAAAMGVLLQGWLRGHQIADLCDQVIQPSMIEIGARWGSGRRYEYQ